VTEDFAAKLALDLNNRWSITAGYRTVEGGANFPSSGCAQRVLLAARGA
jgi:hypothetical protein